MNKAESLFKDLLEKTVANKRGSFKSKYIFKQLKVKNKDLKDILSEWIDTMIEKDEIGLVNTGKDKNGEIIYMTNDYFEAMIKALLVNLDFLLDENSTYSLFCEITKTENPNTDMLIKKIKHFTFPLCKFDKGSRNVPIMFNLYKIFVPERLINITDSMMEKISQGPDNLSESKRVKKLMFKDTKNHQSDYSVYEMILTAVSCILTETGKLILTKEDIVNSRGFKVFFNAPEFSVFTRLIKKIYPFNPIIGEDYISFYPENWLDVKQIKKQINDQAPSVFFQRNCEFLSKEEISTLISLLNLESQSRESVQEEKNQNEAIHERYKKTESEPVVQKLEVKHKKSEKGKISKKALGSEKLSLEKQKKKKTQKSEPLTFLNEIIHKESENENQTNNISLIEMVNELDKTEQHYLLRILDSTKVESGYYSHSVKDDKFLEFYEKISSSNMFSSSITSEKYILKRSFPVGDNQYQVLREKLEEAIMTSKNTSNALMDKNKKSVPPQKPNQVEKQTKKTATQSEDDFLLDDLLLEDNNEDKKKVDQIETESIDDDEPESLIIANEKETLNDEPEDLKMEEVDHESFFEISSEEENSEDNQNELAANEDNNQDLQLENEDEQINDREEEEEIKEGLNGKIISVLTEDQEKWLKIKMMSEHIGFELRDGLAYKPEIAVFDEGFLHLEPIARNTGAFIMKIDEFMSRLGLRDKN